METNNDSDFRRIPYGTIPFENTCTTSTENNAVAVVSRCNHVSVADVSGGVTANVKGGANPNVLEDETNASTPVTCHRDSIGVVENKESQDDMQHLHRYGHHDQLTPGQNLRVDTLDPETLDYSMASKTYLQPEGPASRNYIRAEELPCQLTTQQPRDRPIVTPPQESLQNGRNKRPDDPVLAENMDQEPLILASCELPDKSCLQVITFERPSSIANTTSTFAEIVHEMVSEIDSTDPSVIHWVLDGEAFHVEASHPRLGNALSKYFHHSKYSSFQRQLNSYGWNKCRGGRYAGVFYNPLFHRNCNQVGGLLKIRRKQASPEEAEAYRPPKSRQLRPRNRRGGYKKPTRQATNRPNTRATAVQRRGSTTRPSRTAKRNSAHTTLPKSTQATSNSKPGSVFVCEPEDGRIVATNNENKRFKRDPDLFTENENQATSIGAISNANAWGKKRLLLERMPPKVEKRQRTFGDIPQPVRNYAGTPRTRHTFKDVSNIKQEDTPTNYDNSSRFFGFESDMPDSAYPYTARGGVSSLGSLVPETYPTPQKRLLEEPLMSFSPPLTPIGRCNDTMPRYGLPGQLHRVNLNSSGNLGASIHFPSEEIAREQNAVRVAFQGRQTKFSPLRAFPAKRERNTRAGSRPISDTAPSTAYRNSMSFEDEDSACVQSTIDFQKTTPESPSKVADLKEDDSCTSGASESPGPTLPNNKSFDLHNVSMGDDSPIPNARLTEVKE